MDPIMAWGLELIQAVQRFRSPALDTLFRAITSLGSEDFYFLILPFLLWCVDVAIAARVAAVFLLSTYINVGLKDLFALPRPSALDPSVRLYDVEGYGLPSGHAQHSVVMWGAIADALEETWAWIGAAVLAALIGFSRIYLGVHFPTDVLAGWLVGAALLAGYIALRRPIEAWLEKRDFLVQLSMPLALSLALLLIHATENTASLAGILLGAGVGFVLLRRWGEYRGDGPAWKRGLRLPLGVAVLLGLRFGLKAVSPAGSESLELGFRFLRYAILGLWIGLGAPWLFRRVRLVEQSGNQRDEAAHRATGN